MKKKTKITKQLLNVGKNIQQNLIEKNNCKENEKKITIINGYSSFEKNKFWDFYSKQNEYWKKLVALMN